MSNKTNADRNTQLTEVAITTSKFRVVKNLFVRLFFRLTIGILVVCESNILTIKRWVE